MSSLIILGNTNKYTFYEAIVSAQLKSKELFGHGFSRIYVIHSPESFQCLYANPSESSDWLEPLEKYGITNDLFMNRTITIEKNDYSKFLGYVKEIISSLQNSSNLKELIIDITNGTTDMKSILSTISYILDLNNVFFIDSVSLFKNPQNNRNQYLDPSVIIKYYTRSIPNKDLDKLAYLNLSEITRYEEKINLLADTYVSFNKTFDDNTFFKNNLLNAIYLKLKNDNFSYNDEMYRMSSTAISSSIEDVIDRLLKSELKKDINIKTLGNKIHILQEELAKCKLDSFDFVFFQKFNDFILYLRNSTVHHSLATSESERFKASLTMQMSFIFLDYYSKIVLKAIKDAKIRDENKINKKNKVCSEEMKYYGLDGDNTGKVIESLMVQDESEDRIKAVSKNIALAKDEVKKYILRNKGTVIFAEGDDILFKGYFSYGQLCKMKQIYQNISQGITCSLAFGDSFKEVYLAMKLAKSEHNVVRGITLDKDKTI